MVSIDRNLSGNDLGIDARSNQVIPNALSSSPGQRQIMFVGPDIIGVSVNVNRTIPRGYKNASNSTEKFTIIFPQGSLVEVELDGLTFQMHHQP